MAESDHIQVGLAGRVLHIRWYEIEAVEIPLCLLIPVANIVTTMP